MSNKAGKSIDTTFLSVTWAAKRGFIHRDYIAHCLRWTHVIKDLRRSSRYKEAVVWDIGCGRELPLAMAMYTDRTSPRYYVGTDYGPILPEQVATLTKTGKFRGEFCQHVDAAEFDWSLTDAPSEPTDVVCFEMVEHIEPAHVVKLLRHIYATISDTSTLWLSTPCWNYVDCADNHVNEMTYEALGACLEACGFEVVKTWGTFSSQNDYKSFMTPAQAEIFVKLKDYFDSNTLSCIMGPIMPASMARNCLWQCKRSSAAYAPQFAPFTELTGPWTSSEHWRDLDPGK